MADTARDIAAVIGSIHSTRDDVSHEITTNDEVTTNGNRAESLSYTGTTTVIYQKRIAVMCRFQFVLLAALLIALCITVSSQTPTQLPLNVMPLNNAEMVIVRNEKGGATIFIGGEPFVSAPVLFYTGGLCRLRKVE